MSVNNSLINNIVINKSEDSQDNNSEIDILQSYHTQDLSQKPAILNSHNISYTGSIILDKVLGVTFSDVMSIMNSENKVLCKTELESVSKIDSMIIEILYKLKSNEAIYNYELERFVSLLLQNNGWEVADSANPGSKGKKMTHYLYGTFASGNVDENREYMLDERGIPLNFTLTVKNIGTFVRMAGRDIKFLPRIQKEDISI